MKPAAFGVHFLLTLSLSTSLHAASIGDPAPPVFVEHWVKGAPVKIGPGTNIFVVEFWATWCGPCKKAIPHLTELQKKFADQGVIVVGISDEKLETVQPFVAAQGGAMDYRVVVDSSKRTFNNWMTAYGESGIPCAFIIGTNGLVQWHDYPNSGLDSALSQLIEGRFNIERAKNYEAGERFLKQYTLLVSQPNATEKAAPIGEKILAEYAQDWRVPNRLARAILTDPKVRSRDLPLALRAATKSAEMTRGRTSDALEMLARAQYATGSKNEALATVSEALSVCKDASDRKDLQELIVLYKRSGATPPKP